MLDANLHSRKGTSVSMLDDDLQNLSRSVQSNHLQHISSNAIDHVTTSFSEPIAICGMACRLPGGIRSPQQLWDFLLAKRDARSRVPEHRYNASAYYSANGKPGTIKTEYGYFLDETINLGSLDTSFFSMSGAEVERADPQQRQLLEVSRECIDDAGEVDWQGSNTGVYIGSFGEDWCEMFAKEPQQYGPYRVTGTSDLVLSNRISYEMNLRGPTYGLILIFQTFSLILQLTLLA
jgi:acyl transferase domain-containing protein